MKIIGIAGMLLVLAAPLGVANADPWKDESGHGRGDRGWSRHYDRDDDDRGGRRHRENRERKVEYDDGRCKVERKWSKNGEYKEERKCRGGSGGFDGYGSSRAPQGWYDPPAYRGYR